MNWQSEKLPRRLSYLEPILFYAMTMLGCWAMLSQPYFFSIDGPAHVYSATILNDLAFNADSPYAAFFEINPFPVPNWIGHFLLCSLIPLFGGVVAEKIILVLILAGTPIAFRLFLQKRGKHVLPAYIAILTSHHLLLYYGFYNFALGIVVLLLTLRFTPLSHENITRKRLVLLMFLYLLLYFSHLFVLAVAFAFQCALVFDAADGSFKARLFSMLRYFKTVLPSLLPALILSICFVFLSKTSPGGFSYSFSVLWERFLELWPFKLSFGVQALGFFATYAQSLWYLVCILLGIVLISLLRRKAQVRFSAWFLVTLLLLIAYFVVPDSGLYISERLFVLFFLSLCIWLAMVRIPKWVFIPIILLVFFIQREMQFSALAFHKNTQKYVEGIVEMERFMPEGALLGTLNCSGYWLELGHAHNYIGLNKKVIDVYNYEAALNYFPLCAKGNPATIGQFQTDDRRVKEPLRANYMDTAYIDLPYILLIKDKETGKGHLKKAAMLQARGYALIHSNEIADLYAYPQ